MEKPFEQLQIDLASLLDRWLGEERSERLERICWIAQVGEASLPLVVLLAEDELVHLEIKRMHASFIWPEKYPDGSGALAIPDPKNGTH